MVDSSPSQKHSFLQEQLIHSLKKIKTNNELKIIIKKLSEINIQIPPEDYDHVLDFVARLSKKMPSILEDPKNDTLRNLCLHCVAMLAMKRNSAKNNRTR